MPPRRKYQRRQPLQTRQPRQPRQPRTTIIIAVQNVANALHAIAQAIDRHTEAVEAVRDSILEASGKMPPPEPVSVALSDETQSASDQRAAPDDPGPEDAPSDEDAEVQPEASSSQAVGG